MYVYKHIVFLLILFEDSTYNKYWGNLTAYLKIQVICIIQFSNLPYFN